MKSIFVLFLAVLLSACGAESGGAGSANSTSTLTGVYVSTSSPFSIELKSNGEAVTFNGGVLVHTGAYKINGDQLVVAGRMKPMQIDKDGALIYTGIPRERFVKK